MRITKTNRIFLFTIILSLLVTACGGTSAPDPEQEIAAIVSSTQTAIAMGAPLVLAGTPTALTGDYLPISQQECTDLQMALSGLSGIAGQISNAEPFNDSVDQKTGFGCKISLTTDGTNANHDKLGDIAPAVLEAKGWTEDGRYAAPGIGGLADGYTKGDQLCLTVSYVEPSDQSLCNANETFLNCLERLPPEQIRYGFDLNCAQPAP